MQFVTNLLQSCSKKGYKGIKVIVLYYGCTVKNCNKFGNTNNVLTSYCWLVPNLLITCDKKYEHNLFMACLQTCYKLDVGFLWRPTVHLFLCETFECVVILPTKSAS